MYSVLLTLFSLQTIVLCAQSAELCRQVISTAGVSAERQNIHYDYTIGEPIVATLQSSANSLTQGFQQADDCTTITLSDVALPSFSVSIFPNPTADYVHVQYEGAERLASVLVHILDVSGQVIHTQTDATVDFAAIDCTAMAAGSYYLVFKNEVGAALGTFPFIKL